MVVIIGHLNASFAIRC